ncbi:hypothetical protein [Chryseobacterium luteum]|uniref:Membrane protein n=1 Tax=Chryseobacterium luteum TaxID=421531 RepID=A0A085ZVN5_9FLAO|nr:hypothetical protein [Chryseobacterium luteum]KFF08499.1 membrane protein [Chryseobacterium luteum]
MITQKQTTLAIYALPLVLLCIPLLGNAISGGINWSAADFLMAGILLFTTAFLVNLIRNQTKKQSRRVLICILILLVLALIWIELPVEIFGSPFAGN